MAQSHGGALGSGGCNHAVSTAAATGALSAAKRSYQRPRSGPEAESARLQRRRHGQEELPKSEARGSSREEQPDIQGAVAVWVQEGLEELSHVEGQEWWR